MVVLYCCLFYAIGIGLYLSNDRNYRRREEHGSAKWGIAARINKKYQDKKPEANKILTQNVRIGFDGHKHMRNVNVLVIGGSGAGKTRFYAKPNILNATKDGNFSLVVLDPKGDTLKSTGYYLIDQGYDVRILDLIELDKSLKHPNVGFTADGGREPYVHGNDSGSLLSISLVGDEEDRSKAIDIDKFFTEGEEPYVLEVQSFEEIED